MKFFIKLKNYSMMFLLQMLLSPILGVFHEKYIYVLIGWTTIFLYFYSKTIIEIDDLEMKEKREEIRRLNKLQSSLTDLDGKN